MTLEDVKRLLWNICKNYGKAGEVIYITFTVYVEKEWK